MTGALFTIGYQGASLQSLLAALMEAGVVTLVDVREAPWSRRPEFVKGALQASVREAGLDYVHLGGLGNSEAGRAAAKDGRVEDFRRIFADHMQTEAFKADLAHAAEMASRGPVCLMCMERAADGCHRSFVAEALAALIGAEARHLEVPRLPGQRELF